MEETVKPILYSYFFDKATQLLSSYNLSKNQKSSKNIGDNREAFCRDFLTQSLPPKLSIKQGEIIDHKGKRTGELEIIIIREDCPVFPIGETDNVPIEGVFGVIDVKSNLTREKLVEALKSMKMPPNARVFRINR